MFYKSKKFAYAVTMLLASLAIALLPAALDLDATQVETLNEVVPFVIGYGFALIAGHTIMDALSMAKGTQIPNISNAVDNVIAAMDSTKLQDG